MSNCRTAQCCAWEADIREIMSRRQEVLESTRIDADDVAQRAPLVEVMDRNQRVYQPYMGQLKLHIYANSGLLTVHVQAARHLKNKRKPLCDTYIKLSLVPDVTRRTKCRTDVIQNSNHPFFDEKFSFELLPEDYQSRLVLTAWHYDQTVGSQMLGAMSFGVKTIASNSQVVSGWYYLLAHQLGKRKHMPVLEDSSASDSFFDATIQHFNPPTNNLMVHDMNDMNRMPATNSPRKHQYIQGNFRRPAVEQRKFAEAPRLQKTKLTITDVHHHPQRHQATHEVTSLPLMSSTLLESSECLGRPLLDMDAEEQSLLEEQADMSWQGGRGRSPHGLDDGSESEDSDDSGVGNDEDVYSRYTSRRKERKGDTLKMTLHRGKNGFGLKLTGASPTTVSKVEAYSEAKHCGVRPGDQVIRVCGQNVASYPSQTVARIIKYYKHCVNIEFLRPCQPNGSLSEKRSSYTSDPSSGFSSDDSDSSDEEFLY